MASRHRTNTASYNTYGSVAYAPAYEGGALRSPKERTLQPQPKVRTHERTRSLTRTKVQVREAGEISPFAVVGFLAVGVFAVLVIFSYAQFTVANSQLSSLRSELSDLQAQNVTLSALTWSVSRPPWETPWSGPPTTKWSTWICPSPTTWC